MPAERAVEVRAFAPATVGNVGCGFDVLGLALEAPGDVVVARRAERPGVALAGVSGDSGRLPRQAERNAASVAARALLAAAGLAGGGAEEPGVELLLEKGLPLASGLGSSAASAVAGAFAVDALLGLALPATVLLAAAREGERAACGAGHLDNAAPSLLGGIVLVRSAEPLDVVPLPVPEGLAVALLHPHLEVSTRRAREVLPAAVPLADAVTQWGNVGAFVAALYRGDLDLLGRALVDLVAEPARAPLVPGFRAMQRAALDAGALGASLSGAGPSVFALCRDLAAAGRAAAAMKDAFTEATGLACDTLVSPVARQGARLLS